MRWVLMSVALCMAIFVAATARRVMVVMSWFDPERTEDPAPMASMASAAQLEVEGEPKSHSLPPPAQPLSSADGILDDLSARTTSDMQDSLEGTFRAAHRAHEALANPGAQVDQVAKQLAPSLDTEVRQHAADPVDVSPEVTHELLETYEEQKKILAGQRDTIDSVLNETAR